MNETCQMQGYDTEKLLSLIHFLESEMQSLQSGRYSSHTI